MDDIEKSDLKTLRYIVSQTNINKDTDETLEKDKPSLPDEVGTYMYKLTKKFARIEYPGMVKNVDKALETLGGICNIEMVLAEPKKKLELRFHPENKFNKPCYADRDPSPGLLIKIKEKNGEISYDILGYTSDNFKFNKAVDFQYLPLIQDDETQDVEYVHDKIFPKKLPNLDYLLSKESASQRVALFPCTFTRLETSHHTLYLKADEKFNLNMNVRPEMFKIFEKKPREKHNYRGISWLLNMYDPNLEIPQAPSELALKLVKEKFVESSYKKVKKLFERRPIWTKAAVQHTLGLSHELIKMILPANAYFWSSGPWRMTWTRFGFDPRQDFNSRIYQTLDFRIRSKEGTKLKVKAKRPYLVNKFSQQADGKSKLAVDENQYILSPDTIPPARQMFYQYCDIQIPEIQEMLQRLPKTSGNEKCQPKTGWLPDNFSEQCREIANKYVIERVRQELLKDSIQSQTRVGSEKDAEDEEYSTDPENPLAYSSRMLNEMKKGFGRKIDLQSDQIDETVILTDDENDDDMDQVDVDDVVKSIPATIENNSDVDDLSDESDMELDMEAVEEINQLISLNKQEEGD